LREDGGTIGRVPFSHLGQAPQQIQYLELVQYASKSGVVDSVVREKVLVLRGQDGSAQDGRNVLIRGDLAIFRGHLNERPAVDIVDVTDSGKLKPGERLQVGQLGSIEIDVMNHA
jgi:hypothetical protein